MGEERMYAENFLSLREIVNFVNANRIPQEKIVSVVYNYALRVYSVVYYKTTYTKKDGE